MRVAIRWMIRRDMQDVLAIEKANFEHPWGERDFVTCLRGRNSIGMVAERAGSKSSIPEIVGFVVYDLHERKLEILNLAVAPSYYRMGVGQQMIEKLIGKLSPQRRTRINAIVGETNLDAQLFFRAMGFRAIRTLRDHYEDFQPGDAYLFSYQHVEPAPAASMEADGKDGIA